MKINTKLLDFISDNFNSICSLRGIIWEQTHERWRVLNYPNTKRCSDSRDRRGFNGKSSCCVTQRERGHVRPAQSWRFMRGHNLHKQKYLCFIYSVLDNHTSSEKKGNIWHSDFLRQSGGFNHRNNSNLNNENPLDYRNALFFCAFLGQYFHLISG